MSESKAPKGLDEVGTRFEHYRELMDEWESGIIIMERIQESYRGKTEELRIAQFTAGIRLITDQMNRLSRFDTKKFDLGRQIDSIELERQYDKAYEANRSSNPEDQGTKAG